MNKIASEALEVTLRMPGETLISQRFDPAATVEQVVLNGRHSFCVPEQFRKDRVTCEGVGLCGEFVWNGLAEQCAPGKKFPKLGIGLLTQRPEGGAHSIWRPYEIEPFETRVQLSKDRALFVQEPKPCMGYAVRIYKELVVKGNTLTLHTTLENIGEKPLKLFEYQHNFLAIDQKPVGPGYRLELPFDGQVADFAHSTKKNGPKGGTPLENALHVEGSTLCWDLPLEEACTFKITEREHILPMARYFWRLSHQDSPASVMETTSFAPARLVMWSIEHCICAEVYAAISVPLGGLQSFSRTWTFSEEENASL